MAEFVPPYAVTVRKGHGTLPIGLKFVGLAKSRGVEKVRIRFSLDHDKVLDIPLSAEALSDVVQALSPLHGTPPEAVDEELADLKSKGLQILE